METLKSLNPLLNAANVMLLTPHIRRYLEEHDLMAFRQLRTAVEHAKAEDALGIVCAGPMGGGKRGELPNRIVLRRLVDGDTVKYVTHVQVFEYDMTHRSFSNGEYFEVWEQRDARKAFAEALENFGERIQKYA